MLEYLLLLGSSVEGGRVIPAILGPWDRKKTETVSTWVEGSDAFLSSARPDPCHGSTGRACPDLPAPLPFPEGQCCTQVKTLYKKGLLISWLTPVN